MRNIRIWGRLRCVRYRSARSGSKSSLFVLMQRCPSKKKIANQEIGRKGAIEEKSPRAEWIFFLHPFLVRNKTSFPKVSLPAIKWKEEQNLVQFFFSSFFSRRQKSSTLLRRDYFCPLSLVSCVRRTACLSTNRTKT